MRFDGIRGRLTLLIVGCCLAAPCLAEEIVVGVSATFQGSSRGLGIELYRGSMAYLEHVNASGGVHGRKVRLKALNDGYSPVPAIHNTIELIADDSVLLLFDYVGTPTVTRVLPLLKLYEEKGILLFFPFTGAQPQRQYPYDQFVFNLRASYSQETERLVDFFVGVERKSIVIFYQADAYGRSGWMGMRSALEKHGLEIAGEATYRRGVKSSESFGPQVEVLKKTNPDAVISIGAYSACAGFIRDARDAGLDAPIANVSFVGSENLLQLLTEIGAERGKDYTVDLIVSQVVPSYEDVSLPAVEEYRALMDRYNPMPPAELMDARYEPAQYSFTSFEGFLNAKVLVEILKKMGDAPARNRVKEATESIRELDIGLDETISFGPDRHQGLDTVYLTTVRDGRFMAVKDQGAWRP